MRLVRGVALSISIQFPWGVSRRTAGARATDELPPAQQGLPPNISLLRRYAKWAGAPPERGSNAGAGLT